MDVIVRLFDEVLVQSREAEADLSFDKFRTIWKSSNAVHIHLVKLEREPEERFMNSLFSYLMEQCFRAQKPLPLHRVVWLLYCIYVVHSTQQTKIHRQARLSRDMWTPVRQLFVVFRKLSCQDPLWVLCDLFETGALRLSMSDEAEPNAKPPKRLTHVERILEEHVIDEVKSSVSVPELQSLTDEYAKVLTGLKLSPKTTLARVKSSLNSYIELCSVPASSRPSRHDIVNMDSFIHQRPSSSSAAASSIFGISSIHHDSSSEDLDFDEIEPEPEAKEAEDAASTVDDMALEMMQAFSSPKTSPEADTPKHKTRKRRQKRRKEKETKTETVAADLTSSAKPSNSIRRARKTPTKPKPKPKEKAEDLVVLELDEQPLDMVRHLQQIQAEFDNYDSDLEAPLPPRRHPPPPPPAVKPSLSPEVQPRRRSTRIATAAVVKEEPAKQSSAKPKRTSTRKKKPPAAPKQTPKEKPIVSRRTASAARSRPKKASQPPRRSSRRLQKDDVPTVDAPRTELLEVKKKTATTDISAACESSLDMVRRLQQLQMDLGSSDDDDGDVPAERLSTAQQSSTTSSQAAISAALNALQTSSDEDDII